MCTREKTRVITNKFLGSYDKHFGMKVHKTTQTQHGKEGVIPGEKVSLRMNTQSVDISMGMFITPGPSYLLVTRTRRVHRHIKLSSIRFPELTAQHPWISRTRDTPRHLLAAFEHAIMGWYRWNGNSGNTHCDSQYVFHKSHDVDTRLSRTIHENLRDMAHSLRLVILANGMRFGDGFLGNIKGFQHRFVNVSSQKRTIPCTILNGRFMVGWYSYWELTYSGGDASEHDDSSWCMHVALEQPECSLPRSGGYESWIHYISVLQIEVGRNRSFSVSKGRTLSTA